MRQFKIADRFGDNYSEAIARIMCDVKCLPTPSWTEYEEQYGEREFWGYQDIDWTTVNCWVEQDKERIWCEKLSASLEHGDLANSYGDEYFETMRSVEYIYNLHDDDFENTFASIVRDCYVEEYDILPNSLVEFQVKITITPEDWTFEGRSAGYYSVTFDVDSDIYAKYLDEDGDEIEDECMSIDDVWSDWVEDSWEELGGRYMDDDEALTQDIDNSLKEYLDALGQRAADYIYEYPREEFVTQQAYYIANGGGK